MRNGVTAKRPKPFAVSARDAVVPELLDWVLAGGTIDLRDMSAAVPLITSFPPLKSHLNLAFIDALLVDSTDQELRCLHVP